MHFADDLMKKVEQSSSIVVGIDPDFSLMPKTLWPASSQPGDVRKSLLDFVKFLIDAAYDLVPAVKFQSAYFEQFGIAGMTALADSIAYAKEKELLVILDVKRGDIGSTSLAYAKAYLVGETVLSDSLKIQSDLTVDGMTVNPFLGEDSLLPFVQSVNQSQKGLLVLVKTSNPGAYRVMTAKNHGMTVSESIAQLVNQWGKESTGASGYNCIGAVVGATLEIEEVIKLRDLMPQTIFLMPGLGAQGGTIDTVRACFDQEGKGVIVPISRSITYPCDAEVKNKGYGQAVRGGVLKFINML